MPEATGTGLHIGRRVLRVEDERLLKGKGQYTADITFARLAHLAVVRSDHASAEIISIDTSAALAMPGVLGVWTGGDAAADSLGGIPWEDRPPPSDTARAAGLPPAGNASVAMPQPVLAQRRVRFQGEGVAIVVAESHELARDAAERVVVEYAVLNAAVRPAAPGPAVWEQFPDNIAFSFCCGDAAATTSAFAGAARTVRVAVDVPRLIQNPIEPRTYVGEWDAASGRYTLHAAAGKPQAVGRTIARDIFRIAQDRVRVITRDVGGGFGSKNILYPEEVLVLWAARKLGRPVRWLGSRSENFLTDTQARDQSAVLDLGFDAAGRILGLRAAVTSNLGAYLSPKGAIPPIIVSKVLTGTYVVPAVELEVKAWYTNTPPTGPYRGAGTPEAIFMIEYAMDCAARELGMSPAELRRRNLIPATTKPYSTSLGVHFDSCDLAAALVAAEQAADVAGFASRRIQSAARGRLRGLGYASMIEWAGIGITERAMLSCLPDGTVVARVGTMSQGQSHQTVYTQLVADLLGINAARIRIVQGDTDEMPDAIGTGASRSLTVAGSALLAATGKLIEAGRTGAADLLEVSADDISFADGRYTISGTDRGASLAEVAAHAIKAGADARFGLHAEDRFTPADSTCPNGCHIAEVEIDPETGVVTLQNYTIVQDVGRAINPMVVEAQLMGGVTQGIGQALFECAVFDPESGQLLSGTFMDYAMPRADGVPAFTVKLLEVPSPHAPMGMKSCGEIGATGGPATTFNAVMDALAGLGVRDLRMPATPERVLQAIRNAPTP